MREMFAIYRHSGPSLETSWFGLVFDIILDFRAPCHERKKHPKKICIKNFGGTLAGGGHGGGLGGQILYVGVGFPSRIQCIKNFEGGGSKGLLGVGSKVQFWGPISLCLCAFLGLDHGPFWPWKHILGLLFAFWGPENPKTELNQNNLLLEKGLLIWEFKQPFLGICEHHLTNGN